MIWRIINNLALAMAVSLCLYSCSTTTTFDTNIRVHYTTEKELKKVSEITLPQFSKECYGAVKLGCSITVDDQSNFNKTYLMDFSGKKALSKESIATMAKSFALDYLARLNRYSVFAGEPHGEDILFKMVTPNGSLEVEAHTMPEMDYCMNIEIVLLKEIMEGYDYAREIYKVQLNYNLVDVKTGISVTSGTAKNLTTRKGALYTYGGSKSGGSNLANVRNAYMNVLENCMIELRWQLAEKLPIAGNIVKVHLNDPLTFVLDKGRNQGVANNQQFLVFAVQDDLPIPLGYAVAHGSNDPNSCMLQMWRMAKKQGAKSIFKAWKTNFEAWDDENEIHAVSCGMPPPSQSERRNIQDWSYSKEELELLEKWK